MSNKKCYVGNSWMEAKGKVVFQKHGLDPATVVIICGTLGKSFSSLGSCFFAYKLVSGISALGHAMELNKYAASGLYE